MPTVNVPEKETKVQKSNQITQKQKISVDRLEGRICYFSLTGDLAIKAFETIKLSTFQTDTKRKKLHDELIKRLDIAILMFDKVILHCSDPFRNEIVLSVLEERMDFIKSGKICFIFSTAIQDVRKDYFKYIDEKIKDYEDGFYSIREQESLSQPFMDTEYKNRVLDVLDASKYILRKPNREPFSFKKLLMKDMDKNFINEKVVFDPNANLSQILSLSLSLYQLLYSRTLSDTGEDIDNENYVFPKKLIKDLTKEITKHLQQDNTIARSSLVCFLEDHIPEAERTDIQEAIMDAITLRMDVLYSRMNCGQQMILEFHPTYEKYSTYQSDCFIQYIRIIAEFSKTKKIIFTIEMLKNILADENLNDFRMCYLASMADVHEYIKLSQTSPSDYETELINNMTKTVGNYLNTNDYNNLLSNIKKHLKG